MRRLVIALALTLSALAFAGNPKSYQVTGEVIALTDDVVTVDKKGEKFEIARADLSAEGGALEKGAKVTIEYRMTATSISVKGGKKDSGKKK